MVRRRASSGSGVSASSLAPPPSYLVSLLFTGLSFSQPGWGQYDSSATCYAPDGTAAASGAYLPCNYGAGVSASMCCAGNGGGDMRSRRDTCTAGGLCLAADGSTQRGYCTDPTWQNPACLSICVDGNAGGSSSGAAILTTCAGGDTYCCGAGNTTCCGTKYALTLPASATVPASTVVSTAFVTWTPSAAAGDAAANQRGGAALGIADKAGLGAGLGGGALALAALALGLVWRRKRKSAAAAARAAAAADGGADQEAAGRPEPKPQQHQQQSELGSHEEQINELSDTGRRAEVPATALSSGAKREPGAIFELEGDSMPRAKSEPVLATTRTTTTTTTTNHNVPGVVPPTITTTPTSPVTAPVSPPSAPPHDRTRLSPPAPPPPSAPGRHHHRRRHHQRHHPDDLDEICQVEGGDEACPPYEDGVGRDTRG